VTEATITTPATFEPTIPIPWHQLPLVALDFESTGVDIETDRAVTATVALCPPGPGQPIVHNWLLDPGMDIPAEATAVHGITTERARGEGAPAAQALAEIVGVLETYLNPLNGSGAHGLVIYNAPFDHSLLDRECRRYGIKPLLERAREGGWAVATIDPLVIDKACNKYVKGKGQRQLTPTCARYGIELVNAHTSEADVLASVALARAMGERYPQVGSASLERLQAWQRTWHERQTTGFADFLLGLKAQTDESEHEELETKAAGVRAEAGLWPVRPASD
jgi:DNA polymerase-3 subunit epsilon